MDGATSPELQRAISKKVELLLSLNGLWNEMFRLWNEWTEKLNTDYMTIVRLLSRDLNHIHEGNLSDVWFPNVSFYPGQRPEIESEQFDSIHIIANSSERKLIFKGESKMVPDKPIYELEVRDNRVSFTYFLVFTQILG